MEHLEIYANKYLDNKLTTFIHTVESHFYKMGKQWLISTNSIQTWHFSVFSKTDPPSRIKNTIRTLPEKTTLICEHFFVEANCFKQYLK